MISTSILIVCILLGVGWLLCYASLSYKKILYRVLFLSIFIASCTGPPATDTPESIPCQFEALRDYPYYQYPNTSAPVISYFSTGEEVSPTHRTPNGFYGFDPGTGQAGLPGVFRLRWFLKTSYIPSTGDCNQLPVVMGPMAEICYVFLDSDTPLYSSDSQSSATIGSLNEGDYVMHLEMTASWQKVDLNVGSEQLDIVGWVPRDLTTPLGACLGG